MIDAPLNDGTINSFRKAAELYKMGKEKNYKIGLGILVNNIGDACGSYCKAKPFSKTDFSLPKEYTDILNGLGIGIKEVKIYWEKHIRNRGKKKFLRQAKKGDNIILAEGNYWLKDVDGYEKILLSRKKEQDKYGSPACPLIMAGLALEQERDGFGNSLNIYYIGNDNIRNIPNYFVIEKGKKVAERFGAKINVKNIYMNEDGVMSNV